MSSLSPVTEAASSNSTSMISLVLPWRWLSGPISLSSMSLTWSPFWYACSIGASLCGLVKEFLLGYEEMRSNRSCASISAKAFLYRLIVSLLTLSSSAVCVWLERVIASTYLAAVSRVIGYVDRICSVDFIMTPVFGIFTEFTSRGSMLRHRPSGGGLQKPLSASLPRRKPHAGAWCRVTTSGARGRHSTSFNDRWMSGR